MKENVKGEHVTPILFPYDPDEFWGQMRQLIREEIKAHKGASFASEVQGLNYKPLYKIDEVCTIFRVTRTTIYEWIKQGHLKPYKVRSRVYFLWNDIQVLIGM